jgi:hypothetical protein
MTSSASGPSSVTDQYTASDWTQKSMLDDLADQKWLLIGTGCLIGAIWLWASRRAGPEEKAARRLVRDWRHVDDVDAARDLLGSNVPTILKPALLSALEEIENQVHRWFRQLERNIRRL